MGEGFLEAVAPRLVLGRRTAMHVAPGEVHVWAMTLDSDPDAIARCASCLSPEEAARAGRFATDRLRERHVLAHGFVRHVLARYRGVAPREIAFGARPEGKPFLADGGVSFNLSHSHSRALLAVGDGRELGADVEQERPDVDAEAIAGSYFYRSEIEAILAAQGQARRAAFFRYWVAKEAVLKGEGIGLGFPLDRFEVIFEGRDTARIASHDAARMGPDWSVRMLSLGPGWPAAVAARGTAWRVLAPGDA